MHPRSAGGGYLVNHLVKRSTFSSVQHKSLNFSLGLSMEVLPKPAAVIWNPSFMPDHLNLLTFHLCINKYRMWMNCALLTHTRLSSPKSQHFLQSCSEFLSVPISSASVTQKEHQVPKHMCPLPPLKWIQVLGMASPGRFSLNNWWLDSHCPWLSGWLCLCCAYRALQNT